MMPFMWSFKTSQTKVVFKDAYTGGKIIKEKQWSKRNPTQIVVSSRGYELGLI